MSSPYLSEIRAVSFNFPPKGWAFCNGQLLPINQNQALFSLLGTTYGGNGITTFALPDLRSRVAIHFGNGFNLGDHAGEEIHTLQMAEMPAHTHPANCNGAAGVSADPTGNVWAVDSSSLTAEYRPAPPNSAMNSSASPAIGTIGGSQPHENRQPYLTVNYIIALQGIFPSRN